MKKKNLILLTIFLLFGLCTGCAGLGGGQVVSTSPIAYVKHKGTTPFSKFLVKAKQDFKNKNFSELRKDCRDKMRRCAKEDELKRIYLRMLLTDINTHKDPRIETSFKENKSCYHALKERIKLNGAETLTFNDQIIEDPEFTLGGRFMMGVGGICVLPVTPLAVVFGEPKKGFELLVMTWVPFFTGDLYVLEDSEMDMDTSGWWDRKTKIKGEFIDDYFRVDTVQLNKRAIQNLVYLNEMIGDFEKADQWEALLEKNEEVKNKGSRESEGQKS